MNQQLLSEELSYFNLVHGVTLRTINCFNDPELDFRPKPGMRTPKELIFHIYSQEKSLAEAARLGEFSATAAGESNPESEGNAATLRSLDTTGALSAYARECHQAASNIWSAMSDHDLARPVQAPFGAFPAWKFFASSCDEHWHHRGQLYTYLRLLGKEPPMLYDYGTVNPG
jgi:uncharacterized damage-inducible protein DinB